MEIGVISDTHGILNKTAQKALQGVDGICHAGDIGSPEVLKTLEAIAPTYAVRGNMDAGAWSKSLPTSDLVELGGITIYVVHDLYKIDIDPLAADVQVVISGHTHQAEITHRDGILYFNPGSASYGRYSGNSSVGLIELSKDGIIPRIIPLNS